MLACTEQEGETLVRMFKGIAHRVVAISSGDVYRAYDRFRRADPGPPDPVPLTEDSALRDHLFPYRERRKKERICPSITRRFSWNAQSWASQIYLLRLPMVYGTGDYQHRLFGYLKRMDDKRPAILLSKGMATWRGLRGCVEDMGKAIALCVANNQAARRVYHLADQENLTEAE